MPIFQDSFESGDFSECDGIYEINGVASVDSTMPRSGLYNAKFTVNPFQGYAHACCYIDVIRNFLYARGYFFLSSVSNMQENDRFYLILFKSPYGGLAYAGVVLRYDGYHWQLLGRNGEDIVERTAVGTPEQGRYYCLELYWLQDETSGVVQLFIDGVLAAEISGVNTAALGNCSQVLFGMPEKAGSPFTANVYVDNIEISDERIGCALQFSLTISSGEGGTTTPAPGTYIYGEGVTVSVLAEPNSGYSFSHWLLNGIERMENPVEGVMNEHYVLQAFFTLAEAPLTVNATPVNVPLTLDGEQVGFTPISTTVQIGDHSLTVPEEVEA